jgi:hypothetical protein
MKEVQLALVGFGRCVAANAEDRIWSIALREAAPRSLETGAPLMVEVSEK